MKIKCPNCKKVYNIDDKMIPDAGANAKCECETKFFIKKDSEKAEETSERKELDKTVGINSTLYCSHCGKQIPYESKYCLDCGALINKETQLTHDYKIQFQLGNLIKDFTEPALTIPLCDQKEISDNLKEHTEFGFWDHKVEMDRGFAKMAEINLQIDEWLKIINARFSEETAKILEMNDNPPVDAIKVQRLCRTFAVFLFDYANKLSKTNFEYVKTVKQLEPTLEYMIGRVHHPKMIVHS
jgi:predicted Zn finger-like uncharacterized protein